MIESLKVLEIKFFYILSNYLEIQRQMSKNLIPTKKNFQNKLLKILND